MEDSSIIMDMRSIKLDHRENEEDSCYASDRDGTEIGVSSYFDSTQPAACKDDTPFQPKMQNSAWQDYSVVQVQGQEFQAPQPPQMYNMSTNTQLFVLNPPPLSGTTNPDSVGQQLLTQPNRDTIPYHYPPTTLPTTLTSQPLMTSCAFEKN